MSTTTIESPTTGTLLSYDGAKAIYRRLCEKAKRTHNRADLASKALFDLVCAMQDEWSFNQDFRVQETKYLTAQDRSDFLLLVTYILGQPYWCSAFATIARETIGEL